MLSPFYFLLVLSGLLPEALSPLSSHLSTIPSVTVGVVCLEFKGRALPPDYEEVRTYHYAPPHNKFSYLAVDLSQ